MNTPVEFITATGLSMTLKLFPFGSDSQANSPDDTFTEETNRKGVYTAVVTEGLVGWHSAHIYIGSDLFDVKSVYMYNSTKICRCEDPPFRLLDISPVGTGLNATVVTVEDVDDAPIMGAEVWVTTDIEGTNVIAGILTTNSLGQVTFYLDSGTFYLWRNHSEFTFTNPKLVTV